MSDERKIDVIIVFGQGPVKPVLLSHELTNEQRAVWQSFKRVPLVTDEPDFFVVEGTAFLAQLGQQEESGAALRRAWQSLSRFALKRMGRQNALAAGSLLLRGEVQEIILSGGHTRPKWLLGGDPRVAEMSLPSEAELMRDVVRRNFGRAYFLRYGRPIDAVIHLESESTNTLENVVFSVNRFPVLLEPGKYIGLLSADHHRARCAFIARRFSINVADEDVFSAQVILRKRAEGLAQERCREAYLTIANHLESTDHNSLRQDLLRAEARYMKGLTDPDYLTYWFGYTFLLQDPEVVAKVARETLRDRRAAASLREPFRKVGVDVDQFQTLDLEELARADPEQYHALTATLSRLVSDRAMPPAA